MFVSTTYKYTADFVLSLLHEYKNNTLFLLNIVKCLHSLLFTILLSLSFVIDNNIMNLVRLMNTLDIPILNDSIQSNCNDFFFWKICWFADTSSLLELSWRKALHYYIESTRWYRSYTRIMDENIKNWPFTNKSNNMFVHTLPTYGCSIVHVRISTNLQKHTETFRTQTNRKIYQAVWIEQNFMLIFT